MSLEELRWDDLRLLLEVIDQGSLRRAAASERLSVNTVRSRLARLERAAGLPLLRRTVQGTTATEAGERLADRARELRRSTGERPAADGNVLVRPGEVSIACTEGLGLLWLTPMLGELGAEIGPLVPNLACTYDLARERSAAHDVGLTFAMPRDPDLIVFRVATIHYMLFASTGYVRERGTPAGLDELRHHRFIEQVAPGVRSDQLDLLVGTERPPGFIVMRTNSSLSTLWAAANGIGIAAMPTFVRALTSSVVPLEPPLQLRFEVFCYYRSAASPAIRATVDWIRRCFDPVSRPWFAHDFVHPLDFPPDSGGEVVNLFTGLVDVLMADGRGGLPGST